MTCFVVMKLKIDWCKGPFIFICQSVYASIDVTTEFQDFFFRFSKVKVVILSQIKIVSNIFLLGLNFYGLEFRNYLQIHEFVVLDFMRKKKPWSHAFCQHSKDVYCLPTNCNCPERSPLSLKSKYKMIGTFWGNWVGA